MPDCRAIQYRSAPYCVLLASFLKPIEHFLYQLSGRGLFPDTRIIGKGLSLSARADLCVEKWGRFSNPCALSIDASRFDKHCSEQVLQIEHMFYCSLLGWDPELVKLLSWQITNKGFLNGWKYGCQGRRMSGDMNTALGNCLLMCCMVGAALEGLDYDLLDDGDDCLVFMDKSSLDAIRKRLLLWFPKFGFKLTGLNDVATDLSEIEWCQSKLVETEVGWRFVRLPTKVLTSMFTNELYGRGPKVARRLAFQMGAGELVLNTGVPILEEAAKLLLRHGQEGKLKHTSGLEFLVSREKRFGKVRITNNTRRSFARAFGISVEEQLAWESLLRQTTLDLKSPDIWAEAIVDGSTWEVGAYEGLSCSRGLGLGHAY
jgi:hypothetical protein